MDHFRNPVYEKDRWSANRSRTFLFALVAVNGIMASIAIVVFGNMVRYINANGNQDYSVLLQLYLTLAMAECLVVILITPALTGIGISQERERGNLELFFASGISAWNVVWGKLLSCMNMLLVLLVTSLPVFSLVFVYGGIQFRDLFLMIAALWLLGLEVASISVMCSSAIQRSASAAMAAYAVVVLLVGGTLLIHWAPNFLYQVSYGEQLGSPVAWYHYLLLANPAVTFYGMLNQQAGNRSAIFDLINYQGNYRQNWITENWLPVSLGVQAAMVVLELFLAVRGMKRTGRSFMWK